MEGDSQNDFFCKKCVLQFDTKEIWYKHMETHKVQEREPKFLKGKTCVVCSAELAGTSSLKSHISIYHPEFDDKPHLRCSLCEIGFPNEAKLANHVATYHCKTKKVYVCSICKAEFPRGELKTQHYSKVFYFTLLSRKYDFPEVNVLPCIIYLTRKIALSSSDDIAPKSTDAFPQSSIHWACNCTPAFAVNIFTPF